MCGICGQYNFGNGRPASPRVVEAMAESIAHRGPDDDGFHYSGSLGLGFRRLSIIDLAGGHQPMSDDARSVWVAFNGEIYNFPELRRELEGLGHRFRTHSDTEVIVQGYLRWGMDVLERLNGMFGLALWDERRRRLVLARDAAGIKPLYYHVSAGGVLFGSELRAVLAGLPQRPAIDGAALNMFLRYRYTPAPLTLYEGVRKLAAGTLAIFEDGDWRVERWYRYRPQPLAANTSDTALADELLAIYQRAVQRHLLSDVPVGLLLSGGVDSGLLLGLMAQHRSGWPTFTVGYGRDAYADDELVDAADTARRYDARHAEVRLSERGFEASLAGIVAAVEEPIATSSVVPMYHLCQRAREDVKVALIGQGPDELFGGYTRHLGIRYGGVWRAAPAWLRHGAAAAMARLPRNEALQRGVASLANADRMARFRDVFSLMPGPAVDALFRDGVVPAGAGDRVTELWRELEPEMAGCDELGAFQVLELRSSLPDELLMYADKLSMAHGLEVRVPYLDREVVEFAERLPSRWKIRRGERKWLHRRVCEKFLPPAILRRKKRGFAVNAVDAWLRSSLDSRMGACLLDDASLMYRYLRPDAVRRLLDEHRSGQRDNHKLLFSFVVLEQWLRSEASQARNARPDVGMSHATVA